MQPESAEEELGLDDPIYWVTLSMRHGRIYAEVVGTDLKASARSIASLRSRLIEALELREAGSGATPRIYWKHDGLEIPVDDGALGPTSRQIYRQTEVDRKAQAFRRPRDPG